MNISYRTKRLINISLRELAFFSFSAVCAAAVFALFQWVLQFPYGEQDWRGLVALSGIFGLMCQIPPRIAHS